MELETVTGDVVAIYLNSEDLESRGVGENLSSTKACEIVNEALRRRGAEPWGEIEMELFTCPKALLLLARPARGAAKYYEFEKFEQVLDAVAAINAEISSALFFYEGRYILSLRGGDEKLILPVGEFAGELDSRGEAYGLHLREHGRVLIAQDAVGVLREIF